MKRNRFFKGIEKSLASCIHLFNLDPCKTPSFGRKPIPTWFPLARFPHVYVYFICGVYSHKLFIHINPLSFRCFPGEREKHVVIFLERSRQNTQEYGIKNSILSVDKQTVGIPLSSLCSR